MRSSRARRPPRGLLLGLACVALGCFAQATDTGRDLRRRVLGRTGDEAAAGLERGQPWADAIAELSEGARIEVQIVASRPASGQWIDVVDHRPSLGALLRATEAADRDIFDFVYLRRFWGGIRADDFYLFFDVDGRLISFHRTRIG